MSSEHRLRCGDVVHHIITGEDWVVAYADYETGKLAWTGWPEGVAEIIDCTLVRTATDEQHAAAVADWARSNPARDRGGDDHRHRTVARLYPEAWAAALGAPKEPAP